MAARAALPSVAEIDRRLGRRIARRRRQLGLKAAALERAAGLPSGGVGRLERGLRAVDVGELLALSRALGVPVDYFFDHPSPAGEAADEVAEVARFLDFYFRIADVRLRRDILGLLKAAAGGK